MFYSQRSKKKMNFVYYTLSQFSKVFVLWARMKAFWGFILPLRLPYYGRINSMHLKAYFLKHFPVCMSLIQSSTESHTD